MTSLRLFPSIVGIAVIALGAAATLGVAACDSSSADNADAAIVPVRDADMPQASCEELQAEIYARLAPLDDHCDTPNDCMAHQYEIHGFVCECGPIIEVRGVTHAAFAASNLEPLIEAYLRRCRTAFGACDTPPMEAATCIDHRCGATFGECFGPLPTPDAGAPDAS